MNLVMVGVTSGQVLSEPQYYQLLQTIRESGSHSPLEEWYWISQIALVAVAALAAFFAAFQLWLMRKAREHENLARILERTAEHNWRIGEDLHRQRAVEISAKLQVPGYPEGRRLYWATRLVHLSHVLLAQQVWTVAGRPRNELKGRYANWQRFAAEVARDIRYPTPDKPEPYRRACADYWNALQDYEETDEAFVYWLTKISD